MTFEIAATRRTLIGSGAIGALMLGALAQRAAAAPPTATETANIQTVNAFIDAIQPRDMSKGLAYLSPDCVYRMTENTPPVKGPEAIVQQLKGFVDNADKITFEIFATNALGPIVINHRLDTFTSNTRPLIFEGIGVFFLKNGKIVEWTDYTIRAALANQWPK